MARRTKYTHISSVRPHNIIFCYMGLWCGNTHQKREFLISRYRTRKNNQLKSLHFDPNRPFYRYVYTRYIVQRKLFRNINVTHTYIDTEKCFLSPEIIFRKICPEDCMYNETVMLIVYTCIPFLYVHIIIIYIVIWKSGNLNFICN